jgi:hypothetical protein
MKSLINPESYPQKTPMISPVCAIVWCSMMLVFLITGCEQEDVKGPVDASANTRSTESPEANSERNVSNDYTSVSKQTSWELQQARAATARYRDINNAIKDNYGDIDVIVENMGYHYMKSSLVDGEFDMRRPEILVYNKTHDGAFELVAVEYAIPLNLSATAPEGFTGSGDVWDENEGFGLWLLHAWVWSYNPDGVFNSTNPLVHLH